MTEILAGGGFLGLSAFAALAVTYAIKYGRELAARSKLAAQVEREKSRADDLESKLAQALANGIETRSRLEAAIAEHKKRIAELEKSLEESFAHADPGVVGRLLRDHGLLLSRSQEGPGPANDPAPAAGLQAGPAPVLGPGSSGSHGGG